MRKSVLLLVLQRRVERSPFGSPSRVGAFRPLIALLRFRQPVQQSGRRPALAR